MFFLFVWLAEIQIHIIIEYMDDDDNDDREEQGKDDEEDDTAIKSYSKKKHFGKLAKDVKLFNLNMSYSPKYKLLKGLKLKLEGFTDKTRANGECKIEYKKQMEDFKVKTNVNLSLRKFTHLDKYSLATKISKKVNGATLQLSNNFNEKKDFTAKISHSTTVWDRLKIKYGIDFEKKREVSGFGGNLALQYKRSFNKISLFSFITQYNDLISFGPTLKPNKGKVLDFTYKGNFITNNYKAYLQAKSTYDPSKNPSPFSHTLSFNAQDADAIGTINTSITVEDMKIKSKEARFVIEYDKKYRFGVQKRNEAFEFLIERYKLKTKLLKSFKAYAGNKGFLAVMDGKFDLLRGSVNYGLSFKVKPGGGNFYNDCSMGLNLNWHL